MVHEEGGTSLGVSTGNSIFRTIDSLLSRIILGCALITPVMPKLRVAEGFYIYPLEILLILYFPLAVINLKPFYKINASKYLSAFWLVLLLMSILNLSTHQDYISLVKVFKGLVYVPLIYIASRRYQSLPVQLLFCGLIAEIANLLYYFFVSIPAYGFSIWNPDALSSGFSNKYLSIAPFGIQLIPNQGSHGIWGSYCVLVFTLSFYLYLKKKISKKILISGILITLANIMLSVSREALLALTFFLFVSLAVRWKSTYKITLSLIGTSVAILALLIQLTVIPLQSIPILEKLSYTASSISDTGTESNVQMRIGAWQLILNGMIEHPYRILVGTGFNLLNLKDFIDESARSSFVNTYVDLPESLFVFAFSYGGIFCLFSIVIFLFYSIKYCESCSDSALFLFGIFLMALALTNLLSGASIIADLLYGQLLLIVGFCYSKSLSDRQTCAHG